MEQTKETNAGTTLQMSKKKMIENLTGLQQVTQINQMFLKQMAENMKSMNGDMDVMHHMIIDLQYRILGIAQLSGIENDKLDAFVTEKKTADFNEETEKQNKAEGLEDFPTIDKECTVIVTSKTEDPKDSIFRARLKMFGPGLEPFLKIWEGKKVGDIVETEIMGKKHQVEFLSILKAPMKADAPVA